MEREREKDIERMMYSITIKRFFGFGVIIKSDALNLDQLAFPFVVDHRTITTRGHYTFSFVSSDL